MASTPAVRVHNHILKRGSKNQSIPIYLELAAGGPKTDAAEGDFTIADAGEFAYYRDGATAAVDAANNATNALADGTLGTHVDGTLKVISAALMPGWYNLDLPDAALVRGAKWVAFLVKPDDTAVTEPVLIYIDLIRSIAH